MELSPKQLAAAKTRIYLYQTQPLKWVVDIFGENIRKECHRLIGMAPDTVTGLTKQQEEAFTQLGKIVEAKLCTHRKVGVEKWMKDYASKIGISIMSGQGTGKDFFAALALMWFMSNFSYPKCSATANTNKQLMNVYWSEISKIMALSKRMDENDPYSPSVLQDMFTVQTEKVFNKQLPEGEKGKRWFCEAVTINSTSSPEDQGAAMAGRHERHMLFVFDEAAGIHDAVYKPVEGTLTGVVNLVLIIFNPVKRKGFAIDSQNDGRYVAMRWNSEDSEIVSRAHIEGMAQKYGTDSAPYRIRVLGLPPIADTDALIPYDWVIDAVDREISPGEDDAHVLGVDVGAGGDKSVIARRHGGRIYDLFRNNTKDTMQTVGWVGLKMEEFEAHAAMVDNIGVGAGVYNRLHELGYKAYAADVRRKADQELKFLNKRDEIYWRLRDMFEKGTISIPNDQDLIDQLTSIKYAPMSDGRIKVQSKKEMRQHGMASPDEADAVALTFYLNDNLFRKRPTRGRKVQTKGVYYR